MVTTAELNRRGLRYAVVVDGAATPAALADLDDKGLPYLVEVADGATMASRRALEARGLRYLVPVLVDATPASKASLAAQGLCYAVQVDADILPADRLVLQRQGLPCYVEVDSSGNSVAAGAVGGALLLVGETDGFATDFTYATDASRVAVKVANVTTSYALDSFYGNAGTSPKLVYDVTGALVWSPHNLALQSQTFEHATWNADNSTTTANATVAPDGTTTADKIVETTANATHGAYQTITSTTGVVSVYAKAAERSRIVLRDPIHGTGDGFNLATAAIYNAGYTPTGGATIQDVGNGWYRCAMPATALTYVYVMLDNGSNVTYVGTAGSGAYFWGAQVNRGSVPTAYLPTTTAARFGLAIDYDPVTHSARGLWCEPTATNLLLNNATLSTQSVTVSAVAYTLSFFGAGTVTLTGTSTAGPLVGTGAANRVSLTFTPTAGSLTLTVTGTVSNAQLETGSIATSIIPTLGASATRATDNYNVTPASINHSATAGSWWADISPNAVGASSRIIGYTTKTPLYLNAATQFGFYDGAVAIQKNVASVVGSHKIASAFASADRALTADGLAVSTDVTAGTAILTPGAVINFGSDAASAAPLNGYIRKVRYVPRRKTNAEIVTDTT